MKLQTLALLLTATLLGPMAASAQSVTGHVTLRTDLAGNPLPANASRMLSFQAETLADGTVTGNVQITDRSAGLLNAHGKVICMVVEGNEAWLTGVITHSQFALGDLEGATFLVGLVDNGEGPDAAPDRRTSFGVVPAEDGALEALDYFCGVLSAPEILPFLFPITIDVFGLPVADSDGGNIQIKP